MGNLAKQTFLNSTQAQTFTPPAGVTQITVTAQNTYRTLNIGNASGFTDAFGTQWRWGSNSTLGNGDGALANKSSPVPVIGSSVFVAGYSCDDSFPRGFGLTNNGLAFGWGNNQKGELGNGTLTFTSSPVQVVGSQNFIDLAFNANNSSGTSVYGLAPNGALYAWGRNDRGQLGDGTTVAKSSPVLVVGGLSFKKVVASNSNAEGAVLGLTTAGQLYGWGDNTLGILGTGNNTTVSSPTLVVGGLTFKDVAILYDVAYGLSTTGQLYAWGQNTSGQFGDNTVTSKSSPTLVAGSTTFQKLFPPGPGVNSTSLNCMFALSTTGQLYAWGANAVGQLGLGDVASRSSPTLVLGGLSFKKVSVSWAAFGSVVGLTTAGQVYCWGYGGEGQLGNGAFITGISSPTLVAGALAGLVVVDVASCIPFAGSTPTIHALTSTGDVYSWGQNTNGDIGDNTSGLGKSLPVLVIGGHAANASAPVMQSRFTVVPGTSYSVAFNANYALFNNNIVGAGRVDSVTITYEQ